MSGKGRTLWEILSRRKQEVKDVPTPEELKHYNPLQIRVGRWVSFDDKAEGFVAGHDFQVEKVCVYETNVSGRTFVHTDYCLKAVLVEFPDPVRFRLRAIPDEDAPNKLSVRLQLLQVRDEMEYDEDFFENVLGNSDKTFHVTNDANGDPLDDPETYWRVDDVEKPYYSDVRELKDDDKDGVVEAEEILEREVQYWDYHRIVQEEYENNLQYLVIEMDKDTGWFTMLHGGVVNPETISVI